MLPLYPMEEQETIAAPATGGGEAALSVIRVSGPAVPNLIPALFGKTTEPRRATLGTYRAKDGQPLDNLIYTYFSNNRSYTGEPLLELSPHGNPWLVRRILDDLVARGCRLAEAGEFTRRAFLNGKLDLTQAEAVISLIRARSDRALEAARRQLGGSVGRTVDGLVDSLLRITAEVEAYIDFPEEDLPPENHDGPLASLIDLCRRMEALSSTRRYASLLHDGVKCVILGEPNVGKSSLLNALTGEDRVLVPAEPGTTRDYVEERLQVGPYLLRVVDTAGLHEAASALEKEGIHRSLEQIDSADLLLVVIDKSRPSPTLPDSVKNLLEERPSLVLENKADLSTRHSHETFLPALPHIQLSALHGDGIDRLRALIQSQLEEGLLVPDESQVILSARHADALDRARSALLSATEKLRADSPPELAASDLHEARDAMGAITGKIDNEAMLDRLFQQFCIGK